MAKRERERARMVADMQDSVAEIQGNLAGVMFSDDLSRGASSMDPNRVRPDHFKGMTPAQREAILQEQEAQRAQARERAAKAKADEAAVQAEMENIRRLGMYNDAQVEAMRAAMRKKIMEENQTLAASQTASKAYFNTQLFKNEIDDSFFEQFNTTSR